MKKLSNGQDSTIENWLVLTDAFFGKDSKQSDFLRKKAQESTNGLKEEIIADERQLLYVLVNMK